MVRAVAVGVTRVAMGILSGFSLAISSDDLSTDASTARPPLGWLNTRVGSHRYDSDPDRTRAAVQTVTRTLTVYLDRSADTDSVIIPRALPHAPQAGGSFDCGGLM